VQVCVFPHSHIGRRVLSWSCHRLPSGIPLESTGKSPTSPPATSPPLSPPYAPLPPPYAPPPPPPSPLHAPQEPPATKSAQRGCAPFPRSLAKIQPRLRRETLLLISWSARDWFAPGPFPEATAPWRCGLKPRAAVQRRPFAIPPHAVARCGGAVVRFRTLPRHFQDTCPPSFARFGREMEKPPGDCQRRRGGSCHA